ncbi:ABC transporter ATP-binding protein [Pajaroellobacter abortibovis]|uniref:ABC transporter domain-containing protein n=1 Tax=Pajaroellobacter abortibovis TaxID=1882918 RepID=A0A1L6MUU2_9BACT|nr:ABC transporter ATP-binding protein [Pajaroellobacter abortibovis]APR99237.1 hypothetical protein BCY86_00030 [Pajaroellobacter abortibovis]
MNATPSLLFKTCNLTKIYGLHRILVDVSIDCYSHQISIIQGKNGAGKTTLLRLLAGLIKPTRGNILWVGGERPQIGWAGHECSCYESLSAKENIAFSASLYGINPEKAWAWACDWFGLSLLEQRPLSSLSFGQKQRLALARATLHRPLILLLDEPIGGLDRHSCARLEQFLKKQAAAGVCVLLSTHDTCFAARMGDRFLVLEKGKVVQKAYQSEVGQ